MKYRSSEIFDNFVKIAADKDLIPLDAPDKAKKQLENNPRIDSMSLKDIEVLYGVKPDLPKGMEYKHNIMEDAHPNSVILSPAHDKLNGLVENNIERQNIIINIINRTPNGQLNNPKYAEKELILSLVRLGNDLDNKNKTKLMSLADRCLEQVSKKKINKTAAFPYVAAGVAAIIGALWIQQHSDFYNQGFETNNTKLISELNDFLSANSNWGVGYKYKSEFIDMIREFEGKLNNFKETFDEVSQVISEIRKPRTASELLKLAKSSDGEEIKEAYTSLFTAFKEHIPYINQIKNNFASQSYKEEQIMDKGWMSSVVDSAQVLHGGKGLFADDFDDVIHALGPYLKSIADPQTGYLKLLVDAKNRANLAKQEMMQAEQKMFDIPKWKNPSTPAQAEDTELDQASKELEK